MSSDPKDRSTLSAEERRFVQKLAATYAPTPMSASRRAAFDAALEARLESRQRPWIWIPSLAMATAAATLAWWILPLASQSPSDRSDAPMVASTEVGSKSTEPRSDAPQSAEPEAQPLWEEALFYADVDPTLTLTNDAAEGEARALPPEYLAIDGIFFEDEDVFGG